MIYKNLSTTTKTFYGVTFKPGEEHEVPGYINHPKFMRLTAFSSNPAEVQADSKSTKEKKSEPAKKSTTSAKATNTTTKKEVNTDGSDSNQ